MGSHEPFGHFQNKLLQKERPGVKLVVWFPTTKSRELTQPSACRWSATHHWKALDESYKFVSDLIPIEGLSKELWFRKVAKVQTGTILGLLGSPEIKSHLYAGAVERQKDYYMGEGGGFPRVRVVVSLVNPESFMACLSTKVLQRVN
jgi:hypothetical protein